MGWPETAPPLADSGNHPAPDKRGPLECCSHFDRHLWGRAASRLDISPVGDKGQSKTSELFCLVPLCNTVKYALSENKAAMLNRLTERKGTKKSTQCLHEHQKKLGINTNKNLSHHICLPCCQRRSRSERQSRIWQRTRSGWFECRVQQTAPLCAWEQEYRWELLLVLLEHWESGLVVRDGCVS